MDVFTRVIRGWALGTDLTHRLTVEALSRALRRGVCEIHHTDQGSNMQRHITPNISSLVRFKSAWQPLAKPGKMDAPNAGCGL